MEKRRILADKLKESAASVLPIVTVVAVLCLLFIPVRTDLMLAFVIGALFLIAGMALFTVGSDMSMTQIGNQIGSRLTRSRKTWLILSVSFILGVIITMAEPDLQVLAANVPAVNTLVLIIVVSAGVGLFLMLSMLRILRGIPLRLLLLVFYGVILILALFSDRGFLSVSFDAGGVTTGPMTVPFIMAMGAGVAAIRSDARAQEASFGLVGLCSIGPVLAVLILGFIYRGEPRASLAEELLTFSDTVELGRGYLREIPRSLLETVRALLPVMIFFLIFQFVTLRLRKLPFLRIMVGLVLTMAGLTLFLPGVNVGFSSLGCMLGVRMAQPQWRFLLIPVAMLMGWFIINAEPAVHVLNKQVEELSSGAISAFTMKISLSVAVALAMGLSMVRALTGISILWFVIPGYTLALAMTFFVPRTFTAIAFDSGGVASGPLTAAFMLPFAMGAVAASGGDVMKDAFGLVALVAMMPLITVQLMGVISSAAQRRQAKKKPAVYGGTEIIELWEG